MNKIPVSIIILTFNAAGSIGRTLESAVALSDDVHVVDSYSTDTTVDIARQWGANIVQHPFEHYGAQRNWAIDALPTSQEWELHLDADERIGPELAAELRALFAAGPGDEIVGYYIPRLVHFHGQPLRHGGMFPIYHMRLFRRRRGRCENRRYDQHFFVDGPTALLSSPMIDDIRLPLTEWTARHNRWADAEVEELIKPSAGVIGASDSDDPIRVKRTQRGQYYRLPLFWRAILLFFYRYIWRLGFLDGRWGLIFYVLQTLWFRFLVDAKIYERDHREGDPLA